MEELFWAALPSYLAIGMSSDEYWHGPPELCEAYRRAWEIERDNRYSSEWRQGMYTLRALAVALDGALNGGKAKAEYPDAPLFSTRAIREEIEERRAREASEAQRRRLEAWAARVNKRFDERERQGEGERRREDPPPE